MKWKLSVANTSLYGINKEGSLKYYNEKLVYNFRHQAYYTLREHTKYLRLITRISPIIIMVVFLIGLFPYMIATDTGNIQSTWAKIILFPFCVINLLVADFALWNWFEGKQVAKIWLIELLIAFSVLYLLIA